MHGNSIRHKAEKIDARALWAEHPQHPGVLLPVTDLKISLTNNTAKTADRKRHMVLYLELFCQYCDGYHYVDVNHGTPAYRYVEADTEPDTIESLTRKLRACGGMGA